MRRIFPTLLVLFGLGSSIAVAQTVSTLAPSDPFERYFKSILTNRREVALRKFAAECGIDTDQVKAKYAVSAGGGWQVVGNLRKGLKSLDTDFYTTIEVWKATDHIVAEMWPNSDDVGSEVRVLSCFIQGRLEFTNATQWNLPLVQPGPRHWGYFRRWQRNAQGQLQQTQMRFVDEYERTIAKPKLDADEEESLRWIPPLESLRERKLPTALLQ